MLQVYTVCELGGPPALQTCSLDLDRQMRSLCDLYLPGQGWWELTNKVTFLVPQEYMLLGTCDAPMAR